MKEREFIVGYVPVNLSPMDNVWAWVCDDGEVYQTYPQAYNRVRVLRREFDNPDIVVGKVIKPRGRDRFRVIPKGPPSAD